MRKIGRYSILIVAVVCAVGLVSCKDELAQELTGNILGTVADATTGEPVPTVGIVLEPGGASTLTGSDGNYMFTDLKAGTYTLTLTKEGYTPASKTLEVTAGGQTNGYVLISRIPAMVTVDRDSLAFGDGSEVNTLSFNIVNSSYEDLEWRIEYDCDWISDIKDKEGVLPYGKTQTIVVFIDRSLLLPGYNETVVVVRSSNGSSDLKVSAIGEDRDDVVLNMTGISEVMMNSATLKGLLISEGVPRYQGLGFVYAGESMPTLDNAMETITVGTTYKAGSNFEKEVNSFASGSTYYVRAYARNANGVFYSANELTFQTVQEYSEVRTDDVSGVDVLSGQASFNATVTNPGIPAYTEKGFCYRTGTSEPTVNDETVKVPGSGGGSFSTKVSGLELQETYTVRSYIIQNDNIFYGESRTFNTISGAPSVTTSAVTDIGASEATFNAYVSDQGIPAYSERGFCYSTGGQPTISDNKRVVYGNGEGDYSLEVSDLEFDTYYYVRAYVVQNGSTYYGNTVTFSTTYTPTEVVTYAVTDIGTDAATFNGEIEEVGDPKCTQYGFCYSSSTYNPTINDRKESRYGGYNGRISMDVDGLQEGTTYYVRAFAVQNGEPVYGETVSFTTAELPVVETLNATNVEPIDMGGGLFFQYSATLNGQVVSPGSPAYTSRGFAYGTTMNPSATVDNSVTVSGRGSTGKYSTTVTDLMANRTYYVRAWVRTESGYVYGESVKISTF